MRPRRSITGLPAFLLLWFGQLVSTLGSSLSGFGLGIWMYQQTDSVTRYALIGFFAAVPGLVMSPLVGPLVDRWDRRRALLLADGVSALCTLALALLAWSGNLRDYNIYILVGTAATFSSFHWPAMAAATTMLVPKKHLARAAGMTQIGGGISQIGAPVLAGALLGLIGLQGLFVIDLATFVFAVLTLVLIRIPPPPASSQAAVESQRFLSQVLFGWHYIRARKGLMALLFVLAATNFSTGLVMTLITPLVLSFASAEVLGRVASIASSGLLVGSLVMSIWGGPRRRVNGILSALLAQGIILVFGGLRPIAWLIATAGFCFLFTAPIVYSCSQAIWQAKVEPSLQGRVFAIRRFIAFSTTPLAPLAAGPLADWIFEPLLAPHGRLAGSVGLLIGVGQGRGIGLLLILLGVFASVTVVLSLRYRPLREVETTLPDALSEDPAAYGGEPAS
jgi:MFS family permease